MDRSAKPVNRSLFETFLNLTFLLRRRVSLYQFNDSTKNPKTPIRLHGKKLTVEFRTALYNAFSILKDEKMVDQWARTPGLKRCGRSFRKQIDALARPYTNAIGPDWERKLRKANTCVGLSVADFAASLGPEFRTWYSVVYTSDSQTIHQSDAMAYLEFDEKNETIFPRWHTSPTEVRKTLHQAATMYLGCVEEFNKRFQFGRHAERTIKKAGNALRRWNL